MRNPPSPVRVGALWRRLMLWPRLVIVVTLGFVALFALFSLLALRAVDDSTDRILSERVVLAQVAARELDRMLERTVRQLTASTRRPRGQGEPGVEEILARADVALGSSALGVYLLDERGLLLGASPAGTSPPRKAEHERAVRQALVTRQPAISNVFRHDSGTAAVAIAVPSPDGAPGLVLEGVLDMKAQEVVGVLGEATRLGMTGHGELVGPRGVVIASTEPDDYLQLGEHLTFYREMLRASEPGVENVPYEPPGAALDHEPDEHHVMAFARLQTAPWGVAVGGLDTETLAPVQHLRRTLLLAGAGSLALLWLLSLVGARLLVRPVRELTSAAQEMAAGDLDHTVEVSEGGEIGLLAESLETMRAQLKESLETISDWGKELERTVDVRTAELRARNRQLAAVTAVATAAYRARDLDGVIRSCLEAVLAHAELEGAAVRLLGPDHTLGEARTAATGPGAVCTKPLVRPGECPCGVVLETGSPLHLGVHGSVAPRCPDGHVSSAVPLRTRKGLQGVLTVSREDETPLRRDERRALAAIADQLAVAIENAQLVEEIAAIDAQREVQRMKAELISSVSHELRTPLGFVKSYATTLLRDAGAIDFETRQQFLEVIDEETGKLARMIEELLDASRLQAGALPIELEPVKIGALVEHAVSTIRPALEETGHTVALRRPEQDVEVLADPLRVEQILDNLLQNAVRYSQAGTPVEVDVVSDHDSVVIGVRDHGDGVPMEDHERIFESFYRGKSPRARRSRGIGLGLAICRALVEAHGGTIWVEDASGGGAVFYVSLPREHTEATQSGLVREQAG